MWWLVAGDSADGARCRSRMCDNWATFASVTEAYIHLGSCADCNWSGGPCRRNRTENVAVHLDDDNNIGAMVLLTVAFRHGRCH